MPLKLRKSGPTLPPNFNTMGSAWHHFLATWYEPPENQADAQEIRHAFFAGAIYMKTLVTQSSKLTPAEQQTHISRLYKELIDETTRNAEAPWLPKLGPAQPAAAPPPEPRPQQPPPSAGMELPPVAPAPNQPHQHIVITPAPEPQPAPALAPAQAPQAQPTQQKPMMWTMTMVGEFNTAYNEARALAKETFSFRDHTFRTGDAPAIINHLRSVFANDQVVQQPRQPQQPPRP